MVSVTTDLAVLSDCLYWWCQARQFSFLGAVSSYFVCSLPGFRAYYRGSNTWCRRHPLCCFRTLVRFAFFFFFFILKLSWALCDLCWALGPRFCKTLQQMLTAVPGQHPGAWAPAEPSPKADGMLLLLARFSLVNTNKRFISLLPALDLCMYCVYLNLRWLCQFSQLIQERQPTIVTLFFLVGLASWYDSLCMIWGKSRGGVRYKVKLPQKRPLTNT